MRVIKGLFFIGSELRIGYKIIKIYLLCEIDRLYNLKRIYNSR